jgi:hypothetical protein
MLAGPLWPMQEARLGSRLAHRRRTGCLATNARCGRGDYHPGTRPSQPAIRRAAGEDRRAHLSPRVVQAAARHSRSHLAAPGHGGLTASVNVACAASSRGGHMPPTIEPVRLIDPKGWSLPLRRRSPRSQNAVVRGPRENPDTSARLRLTLPHGARGDSDPLTGEISAVVTCPLNIHRSHGAGVNLRVVDLRRSRPGGRLRPLRGSAALTHERLSVELAHMPLTEPTWIAVICVPLSVATYGPSLIQLKLTVLATFAVNTAWRLMAAE